MIRVLSLLSVLPFVATASAQVKDDPYYPLKVGTTWQYKIGDKKLTTKVTAHEKNTAKIETIIDGNTAGTEHVGITAEGIARFQMNGTKADTPILFLKLPAKGGDTWKVNAKVGQETIAGEFKTETVKVKVAEGGDKEYDAVKSIGDMDVNGEKAVFAYWFVKDKGIVKVVVILGGSEIVMELEKFE